MKIHFSPESETQLFEFYTRWVWPIHRIFVKKYYSRRCKKCGIAEECSPLNHNQVCLLCTENKVQNAEDTESNDDAEKKLDHIFVAHSQKGKKSYDALVLFSGGKDSSYLLHRLQTKYPELRLLALTVDNSFMSSIAMDNARSVSKKLGVDHITFAPNPRVFENMFRYAFTHLHKLGCAQTIDMLDGEFLIDQGRRLAAMMQIPLVIVGYSREQIKRERLHEVSWYAIEQQRFTASVYCIDEISLPEDLHYWWNSTQYAKRDVPQVIFPYYAWNLSEEYIKSEVNRLGLIKAGNTSPLVTNNTLIPLQGLVDIVNLGYSSWEPEFTQMVREGKADKKLWQYTFELLQYSARTGRFIGNATHEALKRLNLTPEDLGLDTLRLKRKHMHKNRVV